MADADWGWKKRGASPRSTSNPKDLYEIYKKNQLTSDYWKRFGQPYYQPYSYRSTYHQVPYASAYTSRGIPSSYPPRASSLVSSSSGASGSGGVSSGSGISGSPSTNRNKNKQYSYHSMADMDWGWKKKKRSSGSVHDEVIENDDVIGTEEEPLDYSLEELDEMARALLLRDDAAAAAIPKNRQGPKTTPDKNVVAKRNEGQDQ